MEFERMKPEALGGAESELRAKGKFIRKQNLREPMLQKAAFMRIQNCLQNLDNVTKR